MMKKRCSHVQMVVALAAVIAVSAPVCSWADDQVRELFSAYSAAELAAVREWEKTWAGKRIDATNIDQVAQFFPESWVQIYKDPQRWGAPEGELLYMNIEPYERIVETSGMRAATKRYAPRVKTDENGVIQNRTELAGFPFPEPTTGLEVAYNMEFQNRGDSYEMHWIAPVVDPRARTDRAAEQVYQEMYFINRTEIEPLPAFSSQQNRRGYHKGQLLHFYRPPEMSGSRLMAMKMIDENQDYQSYLYYAEFRRVRRLSQAERTNAIDGTDMIYDDGNMWDGYLSRNTYKLIGRRDMLLSRNQDMSKTSRVPGQAVANGYSFQRCNTYVVEAVSVDPNYLYGKRVWYIDPETWMIHWQEVYDRPGRLWKVFCQPTQNIRTVQGEMKNFMVGFAFHDLQRLHSGHTLITPRGISIDLQPGMFQLSNLQRGY